MSNNIATSLEENAIGVEGLNLPLSKQGVRDGGFHQSSEIGYGLIPVSRLKTKGQFRVNRMIKRDILSLFSQDLFCGLGIVWLARKFPGMGDDYFVTFTMLRRF